jgi:hypothetical protein
LQGREETGGLIPRRGKHAVSRVVPQKATACRTLFFKEDDMSSEAKAMDVGYAMIALADFIASKSFHDSIEARACRAVVAGFKVLSLGGLYSDEASTALQILEGGPVEEYRRLEKRSGVTTEVIEMPGEAPPVVVFEG